MLQRILEPEVMDTPEEAHDYDAMDHRTVNRLFVDDFLAARPGCGTSLDVGTGTAQIPMELCGRGSEMTVLGIDLSEEMLRVGRENVRRAGFEGRITLHCVDAKQMPFPEASFAAVMSNSIVHHIPEPEAVLAEMVRVAVPGALVFVRDLLRPTDRTELHRLVELYAAGANPHQRSLFSASLHAALTVEEVRALVSRLGAPPESVQQTSDRHWTWSYRKAAARSS